MGVALTQPKMTLVGLQSDLSHRIHVSLAAGADRMDHPLLLAHPVHSIGHSRLPLEAPARCPALLQFPRPRQEPAPPPQTPYFTRSKKGLRKGKAFSHTHRWHIWSHMFHVLPRV